jgi:hypothetical protein
MIWLDLAMPGGGGRCVIVVMVQLPGHSQVEELRGCMQSLQKDVAKDDSGELKKTHRAVRG